MIGFWIAAIWACSVPEAPAQATDPPGQATDPPGQAPEAPEAPPEPAAEPVAEPAPPPPVPASPAAAGEACQVGADCVSKVCEGQGCGEASPGTCAPEQRPCTRDRKPFCGCDGETFFSSTTCPMQRYAKPGPCGELPQR